MKFEIFFHIVQTIRKIVYLTFFNSIFVFEIFKYKFWLLFLKKEKRDVSHYYATYNNDIKRSIKIGLKQLSNK